MNDRDRGPEGAASTLVVVPTYCEAETLATTLSRLLLSNPAVDVLVVDDNSPDGTGAIVSALSADDARVNLLMRPRKEGLGPAYLAGFAWALERNYTYVVEMDADGSHWPEQLGRILGALDDGADLAIGARWIPGGAIENWPWRRMALSRTATSYARIALRSSLHDITSGYRGYRSATLRWLVQQDVASHGYSFQIETAWRVETSGRKIVEVPITFTERTTGRSKMTSAIVFEAVAKIAKWSLTGGGNRRMPGLR
jgi:dolichol-phosphate mannosyltransferase